MKFLVSLMILTLHLSAPAHADLEDIQRQYAIGKLKAAQCIAGLVDKVTGRLGQVKDLQKEYPETAPFADFFSQFTWVYGYEELPENMFMPMRINRGLFGALNSHPDRVQIFYTGGMTLGFKFDLKSAELQTEVLEKLEPYLKAIYETQPGQYFRGKDAHMARAQVHADLQDGTVITVYPSFSDDGKTVGTIEFSKHNVEVRFALKSPENLSQHMQLIQDTIQFVLESLDKTK